MWSVEQILANQGIYPGNSELIKVGQKAAKAHRRHYQRHPSKAPTSEGYSVSVYDDEGLVLGVAHKHFASSDENQVYAQLLQEYAPADCCCRGCLQNRFKDVQWPFE